MINNLLILVCFYKEKYLLPKDPRYFNIQCGKAFTGIDLGMTADNTGDNISLKNTYWSEITGLYWAWKNLDPVKYIGLCSYRRFFNFKHNSHKPIRIIKSDRINEIESVIFPDLDSLFSNYDIVVPKYYTYAYSIRKVCMMNYNYSDFLDLEKVILQLYPDYIDAFKSVLCQTNKAIGHNMFILPWEIFNNYCEWVFSILFLLEDRIDPKDYPVSKIRVFGYMHELLLAIYISKNELRPFYSQITWICDDTAKFKFNRFYYRGAANLNYYVNKLLRKENN